MKKITINVPDDCEVQVVRKEAKFKKGDIIYTYSGLIAIFEKIDLCPLTTNDVVFYSALFDIENKKFRHPIGKISWGIGDTRDCRLATEDEINIFIDALKEEIKSGKQSDAAKKVLKEVFNIEVKPVIRTYQDLIDNNKIISGYFISSADSKIIKDGKAVCKKSHQNVASSEKVAKSMLAMAMISQLMPYYGGAITDEEWKDDSKIKYTIGRFKYALEGLSYNNYYFLAFHTKEQRDDFLKYNERLVKDYLMID